MGFLRVGDLETNRVGSIVIVGAGHAGAHAARTLRAQGFAGRLTLIGAEAHPPYERPPLSKAHLLEDAPAERLHFSKPAFYDEKGIELRLSARAVAIDRAVRRVTLADGATLPYDALILATGSRARRLDAPARAPVLYLRTLDDAQALRRALVDARRVAVIGAGYIGLEVAAASRRLRKPTTVIELADRVMARVASAPVSKLFEAAHRASGVMIRKNASVAAIDADSVTLEDGCGVEADCVIAGIGAVAEDDLAREAGLACDNGVLVDAAGRSSDPAIFAIGDVAKPHVDSIAARLRFEAVSTAMAQAKAAAFALMGKPAPKSETPWFWSEQYDLRLQTAGVLHARDDITLRRREEGPGLSVLHAREGRLVGIESVNDAAGFMAGRAIIGSDATRIDLETAANGELPLGDAIEKRERARALA